LICCLVSNDVKFLIADALLHLQVNTTYLHTKLTRLNCTQHDWQKWTGTEFEKLLKD